MRQLLSTSAAPGLLRALLLGLLLGSPLAISGCDGVGPQTVRRAGVHIAPPSARQGVIREIEGREDVALRGPRVDATRGDFLLRNGKMVAVVSRANGDVIDFGPEGAVDGLNAVIPGIFDPMGHASGPVVFIGVDPEAPEVVHVVRRPAAVPVRLHTFVTFRGEVLSIESTVEPESIADSGMAVGLGERIWWGNVPTWVQGVGFARGDAVSEIAAFTGRESSELSYAAGVEGERTMIRLGSAYLAGFSAVGRGSGFSYAASGDQSPRRTLLVAASASSIGHAASQLYDPASMRRLPGPKTAPADARVEVAECPSEEVERRPYARFRGTDPIVVPAEGCFEARLWAPGHTTTPWRLIEELPGMTLPPSGTLVVSVTGRGKPIPARIQVRGMSGTTSPDWGEDAQDGTALNVAHVKDGMLSRAVPPGRYRVMADRGFEYSAAEEVVEVGAGARVYASLELDRVVDTSGWISADLHLHSDPSPDAPQSLEDRVLALAASGVEVGIATEHNHVSDYRPSIERLGLTSSVVSIVGTEVTTEEMAFGHFNVFPLEAGSAPLPFRRTSPSAVLAAARARKPLGGSTLVQVNHPRMGDIGYLDVIRFDRGDVASFKKRTPWAPLDFDAMEVFNGDDAPSPGAVRSVMKDWFALLEAGHRITATGNSDAHRLTFHEPGLPRTYIEVKRDDPATFDEREFLDAVRAGKAIVSSGPFIRFDIGGTGIGGQVSPGRRSARVVVDAPAWVEIGYIEILKNGEIVARAEAPFSSADHAAELSAELELEAEDWVLAVTGGTSEMEVLFRRGVPPFAFTNPIFVR